MKKTALIFTAILLALLMLTSCTADPESKLQKAADSFDKDLQDYLKDHEKVPQSVLDILDLMLESYVSGTATPSITGLTPPVIIPTGSDSSQQIIGQSSGALSSQDELEGAVYEAVKNIDTQITFEAVGTWCTDEAIYEAVFYHVHDVYMIDAFGLNAYSYSYTVNAAGNNVYQLDLIYNYNISDIANMRSDIERSAKDALISLNLGGKSDYEKILAIDKYVCDTVYYPNEPFIDNDFTPYGALVDGRAVCDGYARAVKILAELAGLECLYISGDCIGVTPSGHAWDLVKVDGEWYQLDSTWNDASSSKDYFLVTDDFMRLSRVWDASDYPPSAKSAYQP